MAAATGLETGNPTLMPHATSAAADAAAQSRDLISGDRDRTADEREVAAAKRDTQRESNSRLARAPRPTQPEP